MLRIAGTHFVALVLLLSWFNKKKRKQNKELKNTLYVRSFLLYTIVCQPHIFRICFLKTFFLNLTIRLQLRFNCVLIEQFYNRTFYKFSLYALNLRTIYVL